MHGRDRIDRRRFVLRTLPACAGACALLKCPEAAASPQAAAAQPQEPRKIHKFDSEMPRKLTYREAFALSYARAFIPFALFMTKRMGRGAALDLLKASAAEQAAAQAAEAVQSVGGKDFSAFKKVLNNPAFGNIWTKEVVQDTDAVYEIRVTECLWAATFRAANAADEGYAAVCHGDYAFASAFNPQLELVRDHTLMQGHAFCNHRYVWTK